MERGGRGPWERRRKKRKKKEGGNKKSKGKEGGEERGWGHPITTELPSQNRKRRAQQQGEKPVSIRQQNDSKQSIKKKALVLASTLSITHCVILGQYLPLSGPQSDHL